jgi:hypothetical protein
MTLKASESGLLPQEELDDARRIMSEDEYEQEFECSFEAAIKGSYYGKLLNQIADRITEVEYDASLPVHVSFDLGLHRLHRAVVVAEPRRRSALYPGRGSTRAELSDYVGIMRSYGYVYGDVWLPHDAAAKTLQTGRSTIELLHEMGVRSKIVPQLSVQQGIQAGRFVMSVASTPTSTPRTVPRASRRCASTSASGTTRSRRSRSSPSTTTPATLPTPIVIRPPVAHKGAREFVNRVAPPRTHGHVGAPGYDPKLPFGGNVRLNDLWDQTLRTPSDRL